MRLDPERGRPVWTGLRREIRCSLSEPVAEGAKLLLLVHHAHPEIGSKVTQAFAIEKSDQLCLWILSGGQGLRVKDCDIEFDCVARSDLSPFPPAIRFIGSIRDFLNAYRPPVQKGKAWPQRHRLMIYIENEEVLEILPQRRYPIDEVERFGFRWDRLSSDVMVALDPDGDFFELYLR